jgi:glutamate-1-semialdehyde aminotransferase
MKNLKKISVKKSQKLWKEAKQIIPGGSQLLSKRAEMALPEQWPAYYTKAKGVEIIDLDGNKLIDMTHMSVGACTLGYADPDVNKAVKKAVDEGTMSSLNAPEEVELANVLLKMHPWADMVRYARTGGESMSIAVRIARAKSGKDKIAFCGYHGWHDWYLSTNLTSANNLDGQHLSGLSPKGVPRGLADTAIPFHYNNITELEAAIAKHDIGVIVMEPMRHQEPKNDFLQKVRAIATKNNIVLVFDEISSGFRMHMGGVHMKFGVMPDIAVLGKAMSNGYPMAAIIGRKEVMDVAEESFISSTYWTERVGLVAALATIKKMKAVKLQAHLQKIGKQIEKGWIALAKKHGLSIETEGPMSLVSFAFKYPNAQEIKTLFTQEMLKRGFLAGLSVYVSYGHKEAHVKKYLVSVDEVFAVISGAIKTDTVSALLEGPVAHTGFARLT